MAEPRLIGGYLAELSAQLPAPIMAELADGLDQTRRRCRCQQHHQRLFQARRCAVRILD